MKGLQSLVTSTIGSFSYPQSPPSTAPANLDGVYADAATATTNAPVASVSADSLAILTTLQQRGHERARQRHREHQERMFVWAGAAATTSGPTGTGGVRKGSPRAKGATARNNQVSRSAGTNAASTATSKNSNPKHLPRLRLPPYSPARPGIWLDPASPNPSTLNSNPTFLNVAFNFHIPAPPPHMLKLIQQYQQYEEVRKYLQEEKTSLNEKIKEMEEERDGVMRKVDTMTERLVEYRDRVLHEKALKARIKSVDGQRQNGCHHSRCDDAFHTPGNNGNAGACVGTGDSHEGLPGTSASSPRHLESQDLSDLEVQKATAIRQMNEITEQLVEYRDKMLQAKEKGKWHL